VFLLCSIGFCLYLINDSKKEISQLKEKLHEHDIEIIKLKATLNDRNAVVYQEQAEEIQMQSSPTEIIVKRFVSVIFSEDSKKSYDYFLGKHKNVQVGDFVEVYADKLDNGKPKWAIAKVVYLSSPGETSEYARSSIKRKSDKKEW